ncbi:hypothetical protein ACLOJK_025902, partial [Asimina triloba]
MLAAHAYDRDVHVKQRMSTRMVYHPFTKMLRMRDTHKSYPTSAGELMLPRSAADIVSSHVARRRSIVTEEGKKKTESGVYRMGGRPPLEGS